jgi:hypothetical protein
MALDVPRVAPVRVPRFARIDFERTYSKYAGGEWAVTLQLNGPGPGDGHSVDAVVVGSVFRFTTPTDEFDVGRYNWQVWGVHASEGRRVIESGTLEIVEGFLEGADDAGSSTHASRMLDLIEGRLEGRLPLDAENYSIGGRSLSRIPITELKELRRGYLVERQAEVAALQAGVAPGVKRPIRMGF